MRTVSTTSSDAISVQPPRRDAPRALCARSPCLMFAVCRVAHAPFADLENGQISYAKNGKDLGPAFVIPKKDKSECWYPAVVLKNAEMKFNFGATSAAAPPLRYPLRHGYSAATLAAWADTSFAKPAARWKVSGTSWLQERNDTECARSRRCLKS